MIFTLSQFEGTLQHYTYISTNNIIFLVSKKVGDGEDVYCDDALDEKNDYQKKMVVEQEHVLVDDEDVVCVQCVVDLGY